MVHLLSSSSESSSAARRDPPRLFLQGVATCRRVPHCMPPQERTLFHFLSLRTCFQISVCASVHSTISATQTEVSSTLPPLPIGVSRNWPPLPSHLAWDSFTIRCATWLSNDGGNGTNSFFFDGRKISLQISTISSRNRLSKTPSLPRMSMSPSQAETQCTAEPFSITSRAMDSSKSSSMRPSTRASCKGVCTL